ncbi:Acetyl-coenzyme A carboxylase carboxyl transferase subunit alpha [Ralstonia mannitolilytica]|uniref:acetyl-CoA carboxylase family protein n=1 Tax=Ralstonia mannitolilytica TaxID=105219 RepID=UPI0007AFEF84|nr:carboxyl transferase domain-containing protein [Ralstonia mannitolilytica]ANA32503.1 carbamoyl-phosphate synthase large subunit [Ralstonia mannitolilytica]CAJ0679900.1 Acetyl-coenzyme A carboxylase carboxyl transferase subunit alpha [Ralstonia mannitolilytica]CAJ0848054.1 Acetyl-coenzyme A carboxylase carboxyl transferase subunit alpha [Ralstonia mannitolilytica]
MTFRKLLIANRGEIAIRIARAAASVGLPCTAVYSEDDRDALHPLRADEAVPLPGTGPRAYLDGEAILAAARAVGADALHPGYGFLSENAVFARRCAEAGVQFIGPAPRVLDLFGDKARARALAHEVGIPIVNGTHGATSLQEAQAFFAALPPSHGMMIKAVAGGGGRGMRAVHDAAAIAQAYARCVSEAQAAFGSGDVYVEALVPAPRHIEIQIVADAHGNVAHLGERECSLQRRHQKLIEIAPSPALDDALRARIADAAIALAKAARYCGIGTFEFLVEGAGTPRAAFYFMEANPRVQVEHTVTEMVTGVDLVATQLALAQGAPLAELGLDRPIAPRGHAIQVRINAETLDDSGQPHPSTGTLAAFEPPNGPGVRVDTCGYVGYRPNPRFDSLLAKLIVHAPRGTYAQALAQTYRALCEFRIEGLATNKRLLQDLLSDADVQANAVHTQFLDARLTELLNASDGAHRAFHPPSDAAADPDREARHVPIDDLPDDAELLTAPMDGALIQIHAEAGAAVTRGQVLAVIEAMKMEHVVLAPASGHVLQVYAQPGATVREGQPLLALQLNDADQHAEAADVEVDLDHIRPDLQAVIDRHAFGLDENRPEAVARRRKTGQRTARENIAHLCDADSFIEYGALAIAAQRQRRSLDDLIRSTPADGIITGIGTVNGAHFPDQDARCMVLAYDYTVLAGTQGTFNHKKTDRALDLAQQWKLPVVLFAEGGGGRPGDTEKRGVSGLDCPTFIHFARLSGLVPTVGIVSGRCFAGNAALLGCADVIIATRDATIGMGGPAMIEGGGLGVYAPEEVGPVSVQAPNGVIDVLVENEAEAVDAARQYLSYFQGPLAHWSASDARRLRHVIPENRLRSYDMRAVIDALADTGSVQELRKAFGVGIITALIRIEGRAFGCIANNPRHLGGAIDSAAADKASRFMQLCNAFDLPIVSLCDTPGFMVGPEAEKTATVRHVCRMFVTAGNLRVPLFTVVLRKGYGLGAMAMAAGGFQAPFFTASWPSGEFGAMGIEGAIRLGYRKELEAVQDPAEREALFRKMVDEAYEQGRALNIASYLEIDAVIDPADTRRWLLRGLRSVPPAPPRHTRDPASRRFIDTW